MNLTSFVFHVTAHRARGRVRLDGDQKEKQDCQQHRGSCFGLYAQSFDRRQRTPTPLGLISLARLSQRRFREGDAIVPLAHLERRRNSKREEMGTALRQKDGPPVPQPQSGGRRGWGSSDAAFSLQRATSGALPVGSPPHSVVGCSSETDGRRREGGGREGLLCWPL